MKIITVPNPTLRSSTTTVAIVDKKLRQFLNEFGDTLVKKDNPKGVGLAAPQVDVKWQIFATQLPAEPDSEEYLLRTFINPRITDHSEKYTYGGTAKDPTLEGCLSIPGIYGPVPRWQWVDLTYDFISGNELKTTTEHFVDFTARVVQHEQDHLAGILFIDHTVEYDLPLYKEDPQTDKLDELEPEFVMALVEKTKI